MEETMQVPELNSQQLGTEIMEQTTKKLKVDENASGVLLLKLLRRNQNENCVGVMVEFTPPPGMIYMADLERPQRKIQETNSTTTADKEASTVLLEMLRRNQSKACYGVEFTPPPGMIYVADLEHQQRKIQETKVTTKKDEEASTVLLEMLRRNQCKACYGVEFTPPPGMTHVGDLEKQQLQKMEEPTTKVDKIRFRSTEEQETPTMACYGVKNCPLTGMILVQELNHQQLRTDLRLMEETVVPQVPQMGDQSTKVKVDLEASESIRKPEMSEICVPLTDHKQQLGSGLTEEQTNNTSNIDNETFSVLRGCHQEERKEASEDRAERKRDYIIRQLEFLLVDQNKIIKNREIVIFTQKNKDILTLNRAHKKAIEPEPLRKYQQIQKAFQKHDERLALCRAKEREMDIETGSVVYYILKGLERRHQQLQKKRVDLLKNLNEINQAIQVKRISEGFKDKMVGAKEAEKNGQKLSLWKRFFCLSK